MRNGYGARGYGLAKPFLMLVEKIIMFFYNEHPPFLYEKLFYDAAC
jgi:hypothetical protein